MKSTVQSCERSSFLTCLSLSFAFPLPHTREDVTSRGMTEIWCSGMFIPVERSVERGVGGTHTHTSSPRAGANGMTVLTATPATHTARGEQRREEGMSGARTLTYGCKVCQTAASEQFGPPSRRPPGQALVTPSIFVCLVPRRS